MDYAMRAPGECSANSHFSTHKRAFDGPTHWGVKGRVRPAPSAAPPARHHTLSVDSSSPSCWDCNIDMTADAAPRMGKCSYGKHSRPYAGIHQFIVTKKKKKKKKKNKQKNKKNTKKKKIKP